MTPGLGVTDLDSAYAETKVFSLNVLEIRVFLGERETRTQTHRENEIERERERAGE